MFLNNKIKHIFIAKTQHCYFLFLFSDIWEETEGDESDDDDKTDESHVDER